MAKQVSFVSRRAFIGGSACLVVSLAANRALGSAPAEGTTAHAINPWVSLSTDDIVTIRFGSAEMGQGVLTSLPMILAEELDADWSKVRVEPVTHDPDRIYGNPKTGGQLYTAGSSSVEGYFDTMRRAGATARRVLIHSAAQHWSVPVSEVTSEPGVILHERTGRRLRFGEVVALPQLQENVPPVTIADLKSRSAYRIIGRETDRLDIPDKTRGAVQYTVDVRVPGMVYTTVVRAPIEGEAPAAVDDAEAKALPGVLAVVRLSDAVAIVAERWETALAARDLIDVEWTQGSTFRSADSEDDLARGQAVAGDVSQSGVVWEERGNPKAAFAGGRVVEAEYTTDYVYHAQMEPLAAVASVDRDGKGAEVWLGTQSQSVSLGIAAQVLGTTPDRIRFNVLQMGGAFGRRTFFARELLRDALLLSREVSRPVKLIWTREDDVRNGWFRPATAHKLRAALSSNGSIAAWHHRIACPSIFGFVAPQRLASAESRDLLIMEGAELTDYDIPEFLAEHVVTERRARISAWRGIGWGHNLFATECFIDELAQEAGLDAVTFRKRLLVGKLRALAVLDAVLDISNYGRPGGGRAHGLSFAGYKATLGAGVAEISLDDATGLLRVHRFYAAVDVGQVIEPRNLAA